MDVTPSNDPVHARIAPPGTAIQTAADALVDLVVSEREDAARASHQHYFELERQFAIYRENANAAIVMERARLSDTHHKLLATQALLAQYQHTVDAHVATVVPRPGQRQIEGGHVFQQAYDIEETSAKQRLEEMQNALRDVGIVFSSEDNSLRFEAGWAAVLAQLEARDFGVMNAGRLHEVLGELTHRLQHDRETIEQLEQRSAALDAEKAQLIEKYELELQVSKLEISLLNDAVLGQTPNSSPNIVQISWPVQTPPFTTLTSSNVPDTSCPLSTSLIAGAIPGAPRDLAQRQCSSNSCK
ncbi:hypothetical protein J132_00805 [Termitomyces sp. J132]|nr:hypothetical protein C0989_009751 [Termitomyces sp. Mn162]KAH0583715.1 hypothetical protein H2248_009321 [Termitomyces sp. 'cryptogamus']KNZ78442.1 hypothetical protein J132_00805 [Termitomyces sp. J132]